MKKRLFTKICLIAATAILLTEAPVNRVSVLAADNGEPTEAEIAVQSLLTACLTDIYGARTEQTRVAREYLGSVRDLARVNSDYYAEIPIAEQRLREALETEQRAKEEMENSTIAQPDMNSTFPRVYLYPGLSTQPVSVTVPAKQACRIVINGIDAFSLLSTGRPCDPGSLFGMVSFIEPYAAYPKWHITAHFYGGAKLMDSVELSGEVKNPWEFRRLDDFVQAYRPGVEAATFRVFVAENHSIMAAWNLDGSVTITDFNNFIQKPEVTTKSKSSSGSSKSSSNSSASSSSSGSESSSSSADSVVASNPEASEDTDNSGDFSQDTSNTESDQSLDSSSNT